MSNTYKGFFFKIIIALSVIIAVVVGFWIYSTTTNLKNFKVVSTTPKNLEENVYPGEILITFTTNVPVNSLEDYSITIDPPLEHGSTLLSKLPSQTITNQVLGGLSKNTTYTVKVTNMTTKEVTSWSFTTSGEQPESSSALFKKEEEELKNTYFPLGDYTPFENDAFSLIYVGDLSLEVKIKKINSDKEAIKKEVEDWIRSKGVDPTTHTINYIDGF